MNKLNKFFFVLSAVFCLICFGASIWLAVTLRNDMMSWAMVTLFGVAVLWFGFNAWKKLKE